MSNSEIEIVGHVSPYKRIDVSHPGRKLRITWAEWKASGSEREPDAEVYEKHTGWNDYTTTVWWELKEKYR